jgi:hypothetical protein
MRVEVEEREAGVSAARGATLAEGNGAFATVLRDVRLLLMALWLGGAVFFSATVAPSVFGVLRSRSVVYANEAAGSIVTRTLSILNTGGFIVALLLLASAFLFRRKLKRRVFIAEVISLAVVVIATGVGQWVIAARMLALRAAMGLPIDDVAADNPLRISFDSLHKLSVAALGLAIIAAAIALLLIARRGDRLEIRDN